jgi:two-component system chemotaxis sensor kinase CheA
LNNGLMNEALFEVYIFETMEQLTQLENIALQNEQDNCIQRQINEVFRIVHTLKGSSAVMNFRNIVELSHSLEDIFYYIRERKPHQVDYPVLTELVLKSIDFTKKEVSVLQSGNNAEGDVTELVNEMKDFLSAISEKGGPVADSKQAGAGSTGAFIDETNDGTLYKAVIFFEDGCEMENVRAYNIVFNLEKLVRITEYYPYDIRHNQAAAEYIRKNGFMVCFLAKCNIAEVKDMLENMLFIRELKLEEISSRDNAGKSAAQAAAEADNELNNTKRSMVSVSLAKMDRLMDLVGELVISQTMVIQNPELENLELSSFHKASRQLQLVTNDIQDAVMSIRMISLSVIFQKMNRIVRDMNKKLNKEIRLKVIGENTEVDKNIIEHLSDPLLHLVRNAADHGIEAADIREKAGKPAAGTITLEAKNDGGDVRITVRDDGRGLDKARILSKARQLGLLKKPDSDYSDREIYSMILLPGFSTKESITEFSGRGVGMDVVSKNIEEIGGTVQIDSCPGKFTSIMLKIPLTLAIVDGMKIRVGKSVYIVPIASIRESFRISGHNIIYDETMRREMIMLRGECYPVLRLKEYLRVESEVTRLEDGIIIVVENDIKAMCLFADELLGVQQAVIKALPDYINKRKGISSCTVMGNGNVSLIIDVPDLFANV